MSKKELIHVDVLGMTRLLGITWFGDLNAGAQKLMILKAAGEKNIYIKEFCTDGIIISQKIKVSPKEITEDDFLKLMLKGTQVERIHEMMNRGYGKGTLVQPPGEKDRLMLSGNVDKKGFLVYVDIKLGIIWMNSSPDRNAAVYNKGKWAKII